MESVLRAPAKKSNITDWALVGMVILMSIGANLPDTLNFALDRKFLLGGLVAIVAVALIRYLTFTFMLVVAILTIGANLPEQIADELNIDRSIMLFALVSMVIVSFSNMLFRLPTSVATVNRKRLSNTHGGAALYAAIAKGRLPTVRALLDQGVNPNIRTSDGQTPLIFAASKGYGDVVQLLLANGADVTVKNNQGKTALQVASALGYSRVAELVTAAGASE